ncbi:hypothetical protein [Azohydromonas lata]|uniref:Uncharacterized protein n=1 Tax=Azohydromonas lata TaxID=45677 RepID=A0ABU5I9L6_9BURK|nr:hypothetical protein [Azohydromonas lata]MDZ5455806.1 hypothetical protein [Azohydromonas lata]
MANQYTGYGGEPEQTRLQAMPKLQTLDTTAQTALDDLVWLAVAQSRMPLNAGWGSLSQSSGVEVPQTRHLNCSR